MYFLIIYSIIPLFFVNVIFAQEDIIAEIDGYAKIFIEENEIPGLGLAIVKDEHFYRSGYGLRDRENNMAVNIETQFPIASVTKGFTAILAAKILYEKFPHLGKDALDTPLTQLVKYANFTFIDRNRHYQVTFRDLLSHRTCLESPDIMIAMGCYENQKDYIYRTRYSPEICQFRSKYAYNNAMFDLAGKIIGYIAERPFQDIAREFFAALGMTRTKYISKNWNSMDNVAKAYTWSNKNSQNPQNYIESSLLDRFGIIEGSGGILSTASDMTKYLQFHLNKGKVGDQVIVPENVLNWVYEKSMDNYALGLTIGEFPDGTPFISHGGHLAPYEGLFGFNPHYGMGIYSVINGPGKLNKYSHVDLHAAIYRAVLSKTSKENKEIHSFMSNLNLLNVTNYDYDLLNGAMDKREEMYNIDKILFERKNSNTIKDADYAGLFGNAFRGNVNLIFNDTGFYFEWGQYVHAKLTKFDDGSEKYFGVWTTNNVDYMEAAWGAGQIPQLELEMWDKNTLSLYGWVFKRGDTIDKFSKIPWQ